MDKDFPPAPLDDQDLEALFAGGAAGHARAGSKVSHGAASGAGCCGLASTTSGGANQRRRPGIFGRLSQVVAQIGGWPAGAGLAMAGAAGVVIGSQPAG